MEAAPNVVDVVAKSSPVSAGEVGAFCVKDVPHMSQMCLDWSMESYLIVIVKVVQIRMNNNTSMLFMLMNSCSWQLLYSLGCIKCTHCNDNTPHVLAYSVCVFSLYYRCALNE